MNEIEDPDDINSMNEHIDDLNYLERFNKALFQRPGSRAFSVPSYFPFASINHYTSSNLLKQRTNSKKVLQPDSSFSRIKTAKMNGQKSVIISNDDTQNNGDLSNIVSSSNFLISKIKSNSQKTIGYSIDNQLNPIDKDKKEFFNEINAEYLEINDKYGEFDSDDDDVMTDSESKNKDNNNNYNNDDDDDSSENKLKINNSKNSKIFPNISSHNLKLSLNRFKSLEGDKLSFEDEDDDDDDNNYELKKIIENDKTYGSFNEYKLRFLGSVKGMDNFRSFLNEETGAGGRYLKFWLECEFYRDSMQDYDEIETMATRNRLFRDINTKYVFSISKKMHEKISENYLNKTHLTYNIFDAIQYDFLRRLRSYWTPRFILHRLRSRGKDCGAYPMPPLTPIYDRQSTIYKAALGIPSESNESIIAQYIASYSMTNIVELKNINQNHKKYSRIQYNNNFEF
jgi:hypothetical protein